MRRRLLNLLTALSLLLCVAACVLWVRSYLVRERLERSHWWIAEWDGGSTTHQRNLIAETGRGFLHLYVFNNLTRRNRTPAEKEESRRRSPNYYGAGVVRWER